MADDMKTYTRRHVWKRIDLYSHVTQTLNITDNTQTGVRIYSYFHCGPGDIVTVMCDKGWLQINNKYTALNI